MYPLSPSRQRGSDLDQIAGHAQGIMLRRVPRYARSIGANESRQLYRCRPQMDKGLPIASSTVITPSLPTFFIASARNLPISTSPLEAIVPTWAISSLEVTFFEFFFRSATTASTARSMPRLRSIGFMPAATDLAPSRTIACARTVAVVVPSPAKSDDFEATSRTI